MWFLEVPKTLAGCLDLHLSTHSARAVHIISILQWGGQVKQEVTASLS